MARVYVPNPGRVWNPIQSYPRNKPCYCGSTVKFKDCCRGKVTATCTAEEEPRFRAFVEGVKDGTISPEQLLKERLERDQERAEAKQKAGEEAKRLAELI